MTYRKLLKEWKGFLKEGEDFIKHNFEFLKNKPVTFDQFGEKYSETFFDKFGYTVPQNEKAQLEMISSVPPLRRSKIVQPVRAGTQGITYKLDNDHILKLFFSGYADDLHWYKKLQDQQFSGHGNINRPAIYDFGEGAHGIRYGEMGKVFAFNQWIEMTGRGGKYPDENEIFGTIRSFIRGNSWDDDYDDDISSLDLRAMAKKVFKHLDKRYGGKGQEDDKPTPLRPKPDPEKFKKAMDPKHPEWASSFDPEDYPEVYGTKTKSSRYVHWNDVLTHAEVIEYLRLLRQLDPSEMNDLHSGNFGIIPSANKKKPERFVIFDI